MEVKAGYKRTDMGVIPEDWDNQLLAALTAYPVQNGIFNNPEKKGRGYKLINVVNLYVSNPIDVSNLELVDATKAELDTFKVNHGDIFFTRSSLTADGIAQCNVYDEKENELILFDCHLIRVKPDKKKVNPFFLFRYCQASNARKYFITNAKTTTMTTIDQAIIGKLPVSLPPLLEQNSIATALSDIDLQISLLIRLITKKRDMKQAAMQELLTGKQRLPGFDGEWETKRLGEIGECFIGLTYDPNNVKSNGLLVLRASNIDNNGLKFDDNVFVDVEIPEKLIVRKDDILICVRSGSRDLIGKCALISTNVKDMTFGAFMSIFRTQFSHFVFYQFQSGLVKKQIYENIGATINQITNKNLKSFQIPFPKDENEQRAIATVLSDMDAELAALEQQRDKTKAIKQGMMQELLTGRIRLV